MRLKTYVDDAFSAYQLIGPQFAILTLLESGDCLTQIELGRFLLTDRATMVKLIDGLEKRQFVVRKTDERDRRVNRVGISPKGRTILKRLNAERLKIEKSFLALLPSAQRMKLARAMFQLASGTYPGKSLRVRARTEK